MAVSSYLRECGYELGGLLPKIYLIHKNALKLAFKAKGIEVSVVSRQDGDIFVLEGSMVQFKQDETHNGKYRFTSTLEITINEQYKEPFFYGLRTLRTNQYYIIIEDKKGVQYLINPELYTKMTYEYSFGDGEGLTNNVIINYNNLSNYPALIFDENIEDSKSFLGKECVYNYGQAIELLLFDHKDLKVKDDGCKVSDLYIEDSDMIKRVDHMKESLAMVEQYDGTGFTTSLSFSIPLNDRYGWAYNLLEFEDNKYSCVIRTTNDNYIIGGVERGLFPSYSIETSDDDSIPNIVKIQMEQRSQYPLLWTDELTRYRWTVNSEVCFGYDKYQMLVKEESKDWGETWIETDVKKKGDIICYDCEECKKYSWYYDGTICGELTQTTIEWVNTNEFLCENGNKYYKTQQKINGVIQEVYGLGELIESNSDDCRYIAVRWVDEGHICYEIDEDLNDKSDKVGEVCSGTTLMNQYNELVTHNGEDYFESGEFVYDEELTNCCACGYREEEWRNKGTICGKDISSQYDPYTLYDKSQKHLICADGRTSVDEMTDEIEYTVQETECCECGWTGFTWVFNDEYICATDIEDVVIGNLEFISTSGDWLQEGYTFTSNTIAHSKTTVQRINFRASEPTSIILNIDQSSENNYDYLLISKIDKTVVNNTGSTNNYTNWKGKTTGSVEIPVNTSGDHFIELMYSKDNSQTNGRDNVIVTIPSFNYPENYKYEIWREAKACDVSDFTGNVKYLNGVPSYDCGLVTYQWREDIEVCGTELPENITEVDKAPEINTDFE